VLGSPVPDPNPSTMPCCLLAAAVVAVPRSRWTSLHAMWLRRTNRAADAALLLEDDIRVIAAARDRAAAPAAAD
jgi:hypothetical protein